MGGENACGCGGRGVRVGSRDSKGKMGSPCMAIKNDSEWWAS